MYYVSLLLTFVEPISALMLASTVLHNKRALRLVVWVRVWFAVLAFGLLVHASQQLTFVYDWTPPRTWTWALVMIPVNGLIWTAYVFDKLNRRNAANAEHKTLGTY